LEKLSSIIIPFYNNWELTHSRLMELYNYTDSNACEIILVNDASTDDEIDRGVAWWQKQIGKDRTIRYLKNKENLGFGGSMNRGASKAHGDIVVLLSNDVKISGVFLGEVRILLENTKSLVGGEYLGRFTGWNKIDGVICPYLNGWFLASKKEDWDLVGGFDPNFGKFDAEDIDLSLRYLQAGYNLIQITQSKVHHVGGQTVNKYHPDREAQTKRNIAYLNKKWSGKLDFLKDRIIGE